jgi:hypothetical protein
MNRGRAILLSLLCAALLATSLAILAGCSQGKPQVIVFLGKSSRSYDQTKAVIDKMKKQFDDKVIWVEYDYDSPSSKSAIAKYHVSMDPTILVTNAAGQVKFQALGAPREVGRKDNDSGFDPGSHDCSGHARLRACTFFNTFADGTRPVTASGQRRGRGQSGAFLWSSECSARPGAGVRPHARHRPDAGRFR